MMWVQRRQIFRIGTLNPIRKTLQRGSAFNHTNTITATTTTTTSTKVLRVTKTKCVDPSPSAIGVVVLLTGALNQANIYFLFCLYVYCR